MPGMGYEQARARSRRSRTEGFYNPATEPKYILNRDPIRCFHVQREVAEA